MGEIKTMDVKRKIKEEATRARDHGYCRVHQRKPHDTKQKEHGRRGTLVGGMKARVTTRLGNVTTETGWKTGATITTEKRKNCVQKRARENTNKAP